jgi:hypothetical protein
VFLLLTAPPGGGRQFWLYVLPGSAFGLLMAVISYAGAWRMKHSIITMGPDSFTYALAPKTFLRNPFSMNTGTVRYDAIKGVETRQEWIKAKGVKGWYSTVFIALDGAPRETFARSGVADRAWVDDFARDVAARANVPLVDRGEFNAQYNGMNHPW